MAVLPPWPVPLVMSNLVAGNGMRHDSAALCSDGRIIYTRIDVPAAGAETAEIYQHHYDTLIDFATANNVAATAGTGLKATISPTSMINPVATAWRHPSGTGDLYLFVAYQRLTTPITAKAEVWRSPSGNGESAPGVPDWVLHGTIYTRQPGDFGFGAGQAASNLKSIGQPFVTSGGRWVLSLTIHPDWGDCLRQGVYTSDNGGVSWTGPRLNVGYYILSGIFGHGQGRNIVDYDGRLWWGSRGQVGESASAWSSDGGINWTTFIAPPGIEAGYAGYQVADGSSMYRINVGGGATEGGGTGQLESIIDVEAGPDVNITAVNAGVHAIVQQIDNNDFFMSQGQLLILPITFATEESWAAG